MLHAPELESSDALYIEGLLQQYGKGLSSQLPLSGWKEAIFFIKSEAFEA